MAQSTIYDETYIVGEVERVIFLSEQTRFTVLKVLIGETNTHFSDEVIVTGYFHAIAEGETYRFTGKITSHARFGEQFSAETFKKEQPTTVRGVIQYLSGETFPGIGEKTAKKIVETLGVEALGKIADDRTVLRGIEGLSAKKQEMIHNRILENSQTERLVIKLTEYGFGARMSAKIMKTYQDQALHVIEKDPYRLVMDIEGVGFQTADRIAYSAGIARNDETRLQAGIMYIMEGVVMSEGHTYMDYATLVELTGDLLNHDGQEYFTQKDIGATIDALSDNDKLVQYEDRIYIPSLFYSEYKSSEQIYRMINNRTDVAVSEEKAGEVIGEVGEKFDIHYNAKQKSAMIAALTEKISIITGGPGTGKTTIVKGIIRAYHELHDLKDHDEYDKDEYPIRLVAPTGRASKRLSETAGIPASTIHRMIGWGMDTEKDEMIDAEIDADLIIIDEMSMVDTWLFYQLMRNVKPYTSLVFVGDRDQLPSVGPGTVFKDLIESEIIPVTELDTIYRQGEGSSIIRLAHEIKEQRKMDITQKFKDRLFIPAKVNQIPELVDNVVNKAVSKGYDMRDIQVLAPIYKGNAGILKLNQILQSILNPEDEGKNEIAFGDVIFREGDKVIQLVNRAEDNIFNGDSGVIDSILFKDQDEAEKDSILVDYDGIHIAYERKELTELAHAYCTSIHKAQGSEYPIVIMPVVRSYRHMLMKNIVYTGITRAKESLILCGDPDAFYESLEKEGIERRTSLYEMIRLLFGRTPEEKPAEPGEIPEVLSEETMFTIPAMINMGGVTPYDFI
ncbi:ATP-dependent RecD-like DNA helicase [Salinicoccus cyprini]|uniref:ATP-dependent RecD2 DNA helicase n=1 Tax=Salinicoccus cyprini TaxID=2493691 RepID=A0A558AYK7_9STAP|nr:ATP-dependent RecD-like DNA helicase [Salinicoccus cyprini]TVT29343.1 ATP-dependent RecD-like DNA helicase [Salinicoccus cyprini]